MVRWPGLAKSFSPGTHLKDEKTEAPGEHIPCPAGWWQISRPALNFVLQCEDSGGYLENAILMTFY